MKSRLLHKDELATQIFMQLLDRWDIKDGPGAEKLALASLEIADAFINVQRQAFAGESGPPRKTAEAG